MFSPWHEIGVAAQCTYHQSRERVPCYVRRHLKQAIISTYHSHAVGNDIQAVWRQAKASLPAASGRLMELHAGGTAATSSSARIPPSLQA